jgi:ketosteroid isomerase-like protein
MTTKEVADQLISFCRNGDWAGAHNTLYAANVESIEPYETPDFPKRAQGLDAIRKKGEKFDSMVETMHSIETSDPLVAGNAIAFVLEMDMTIKGKGRMKSPELCVYQVKDGKVISEEFFV